MPIPAVWKSVVAITRSERIHTSRLGVMRQPRGSGVKGGRGIASDPVYRVAAGIYGEVLSATVRRVLAEAIGGDVR